MRGKCLKNQDRIYYIDIIKFFAMNFVIWSHLESFSPILKSFAFTAGLSLFFFCSGFVYKSGQDFGHFIIKKARALLIPWCSFSLLILVLAHIFSKNIHLPLYKEIFLNCLQIKNIHCLHWFLPALFVSFIPFWFFVEKIIPKIGIKRAFLISMLLCCIGLCYRTYVPQNIFLWNNNHLPWHLDYLPISVFWLFVGYVFRQKERNQDERLLYKILVTGGGTLFY